MWKLNIQSIKAHSIQKCCGVSLGTSASVMKEAIKRKWSNMNARPYATRINWHTFEMRLSTMSMHIQRQNCSWNIIGFSVQQLTAKLYSWLPGDGNASVGRRRQVGAGKDPMCKNDMLGDCSHVQIKFWLRVANLFLTCMWFPNHGKHIDHACLQMSCWESTLSKRATDFKFLSKDPFCTFKFAGF